MFIFVTQLVIGFSIVSAAILLIAYAFFIREMPKTAVGIAVCALLLAALSGLQLMHWMFIESGADLFQSKLYVILLLTVPPAFFFFSRAVLLPEATLSIFHIAHFLPVALSFLLPISLVIPVALAIGAGYSLWIARIVYGMRRHVRRFKFELFFFGFFALVAVLVLILGLSAPYIDASIFYFSYAHFTGIALILVVAALISFPELLADINEAARSAYATSTLTEVDVEEKLERLDGLMKVDKLYQNENLNLAMVAEAAELSSHQLSELINTRFGLNFSRYIREQRVAEAKRLLKNDAASSVLSIGLTTGFRSQSNFYTAFRELSGQSPGDYRKNPGED